MFNLTVCTVFVCIENKIEFISLFLCGGEVIKSYYIFSNFDCVMRIDKGWNMFTDSLCIQRRIYLFLFIFRSILFMFATNAINIKSYSF